MWKQITYPFPNINGAIIEVCEWISDFIPHFTSYIMWYGRLSSHKGISKFVEAVLYYQLRQSWHVSCQHTKSSADLCASSCTDIPKGVPKTLLFTQHDFITFATLLPCARMNGGLTNFLMTVEIIFYKRCFADVDSCIRDINAHFQFSCHTLWT